MRPHCLSHNPRLHSYTNGLYVCAVSSAAKNAAEVLFAIAEWQQGYFRFKQAAESGRDAHFPLWFNELLEVAVPPATAPPAVIGHVQTDRDGVIRELPWGFSKTINKS